MTQRISHRVVAAVARAIAAGAVAATPLVVPAIAQAQQAPQAQALALDEVVVTAERRATNIQDTPISLVALSEEVLAATQAGELE